MKHEFHVNLINTDPGPYFNCQVQQNGKQGGRVHGRPEGVDINVWALVGLQKETKDTCASESK